MVRNAHWEEKKIIFHENAKKTKKYEEGICAAMEQSTIFIENNVLNSDNNNERAQKWDVW